MQNLDGQIQNKNVQDRDKLDIKSLNLQELTEELAAQGEKAFRAKQMYEWMHGKLARSFDEMTNLSKPFREQCAERYQYTALRMLRMQESKLDGTRKFLFGLSDGNLVESVWMRYKHGNSVCISSQVGCRMGCRFCASTIDGLERSLAPSEMLDQIYAITRITGERVSNVVVMGIGEPMDNYENLIKFIRLLTDENGLHISQRNVTVSTCGIVPRMRQLAEEKLQITLALSLHATTDEKRKRLMPIANRYSIRELMETCRYYFDCTGRRITFEYSLVGGVNDTDEDARELIALAEPLCCHVNLIPVNPIKERDFVQSEAARIQAFKNKLERNKINVTIRREMGRDIDGACGQLRRKNLAEASLEDPAQAVTEGSAAPPVQEDV
ncbi:MAG: 23S rRNA (adenine(2503)-C(2))-methyltransferase RlmN [Lachnospiraceae bacterium]|nr:23S rRNA (adenine(2503)-C(2))-methyltransferase RlmN [Lachnospiraceae bacterium]